MKFVFFLIFLLQYSESVSFWWNIYDNIIYSNNRKLESEKVEIFIQAFVMNSADVFCNKKILLTVPHEKVQEKKFESEYYTIFSPFYNISKLNLLDFEYSSYSSIKSTQINNIIKHIYITKVDLDKLKMSIYNLTNTYNKTEIFIYFINRVIYSTKLFDINEFCRIFQISSFKPIEDESQINLEYLNKPKSFLLNHTIDVLLNEIHQTQNFFTAVNVSSNSMDEIRALQEYSENELPSTFKHFMDSDKVNRISSREHLVDICSGGISLKSINTNDNLVLTSMIICSISVVLTLISIGLIITYYILLSKSNKNTNAKKNYVLKDDT